MLDLQGFLAEHKDAHLQIDKPVPLDHIGALTAQASDTIVFNNVDGFPQWRLVDLLFATRAAQARVLQCDPDEVVARLSQILRDGPRPLVEIGDAPCQEQVFKGDDVDLSMIPIVTHTDRDPYPYSTGFVTHRDPVSGQLNSMNPRSGVLSRNEMVTSFVTSTANAIHAKYAASGEKMPQAQALGVHPAWELASVYSHPHRNWWELELFETITGQPGNMVRCKTVDLLVPADASVIIEGYVSTTRRAQDGPSPGPSMLYTPGISQQPVFEVTAITMRNDPVYRSHQMTPFTDHQELPRLMHEAIIYDRLEALGVRPRTVHFNQAGGSLMCVIQIEPAFDGQVTDALMSVLGSSWLNTKMVVAVDPDIDPYDYRDVTYAIATRVNPSRDVVIVDNARGTPFDPTSVPILEAFENTVDTRFPSVVGKWGIDATKPVSYRPRERANYHRAWPKHWGEINLTDYTS